MNNSEQQPPQVDNEMLLQLANFTKALTENCNSIQSTINSSSPIVNNLGGGGNVEEEECNLFGRQVSMDLKRLNLQNRAIARYHINKILMELTVKECPGGEAQELNFN